MNKFLSRRGCAVALGIFIAAINPTTAAYAQTVAAPAMSAAAQTIKSTGAATAVSVSSVTTAVANQVLGPTPAMIAAAKALPAAKTVSGVPVMAKEAAWLYRSGWSVHALADRYGANAPQLDEQSKCIAVAVYHEARGESAEGQLAVARVIMNRAASGLYPSDWCSVVKQPWQFSYVRAGQFPYTDTNCTAWRRAVGIAQLATSGAVPTLSTDVLWYHADYVAPSWGRRLSRAEKIGTHIFYRA